MMPLNDGQLIGCAVTEILDGTTVTLGTVVAVHWRHWGRQRKLHVHSVQLDHYVQVTPKHALRTVLVWRAGRGGVQ